VNQASSIQNFGVTCESITLGHNPSSMPLTTRNIFLPRQRPLFFSEHVVECEHTTAKGMSSGALMGMLTGLRSSEAEEENSGINDFLDEVIEAEEEKKAEEAMKQGKNGKRRARKSRRKEAEQVADAGPGVFRSIEPLRGKFFGSWMAWDERYRGMASHELMDRQYFIQSLYETRIAALHRFVAFLVMFHAMAKRVRDFWPRVSFGLLGYDMSRTHSIMRIATTASPVSGMEVREKTIELAEATAHAWGMHVFQMFSARWYCFVRQGGGEEESEEKAERLETMLALLYSKSSKEEKRSLVRGASSPDVMRRSISSSPDGLRRSASTLLAASFQAAAATPDATPQFTRPPRAGASLNATEDDDSENDKGAGLRASRVVLEGDVPASACGTAYEAQYAALAELSKESGNGIHTNGTSNWRLST